MARTLPAVLATGVGSLPWTDPREATRVVVGELDVPHIPELPLRGPGADMVGRGLGLLVDLPAEWGPRGWRFSDSAGADLRRGRAWLREDLDAVEEHAEALAGRAFKVQVAGPWTLLASTELGSGHRAVRDDGAVRDVVASLAEGVGQHVAELRRRLPDVDLILEIDEPSLPSVLAGSLPTASGMGRLAAVDEVVVRDALTAVIAAAFDHQVGVGLHCCAPDAPVTLMWQAGAGSVSVDLGAVGQSKDEELGRVLEGGAILVAGVVPSTRGGPGPSDPAASVAAVTSLFGRLGLSVHDHDVAVTPTCGLAGADAAYARDAMSRCVEVARRLGDVDE